MRKILLFATMTALMFSINTKVFAVCSGATLAGAISPNGAWQTISVNTYRYYTFVSTYPGELSYSHFVTEVVQTPLILKLRFMTMLVIPLLDFIMMIFVD
jgi:hypothetical protein